MTLHPVESKCGIGQASSLHLPLLQLQSRPIPPMRHGLSTGGAGFSP
jgi:hypothetical protein